MGIDSFDQQSPVSDYSQNHLAAGMSPQQHFLEYVTVAGLGVDAAHRLLLTSLVREAGGDMYFFGREDNLENCEILDKAHLVVIDGSMSLDSYAKLALKRSPLDSQRPIVVLSCGSHYSVGEESLWLELGISEVLYKPLDPVSFYSKVESLSLRGEAILSHYHNDERIKPLLPGFVENLRLQVGEIGEILEERQDLFEFRRLLHKLKGACGSYGFQSLYEKISDLESDLNDSHVVITELKGKFFQFKEMISRVRVTT